MNALQHTAARVLAMAVLMSVGLSPAWGEDGKDRFMSRTRQLTFEGLRAGEGYFSPDGKKLIFQSERDPENPFFQIFMLDFETGDVHQVSPGTGKTTCSFFQPGTDRVLFASTHLDPDAKKHQKETLEMRAAGKEPRYSWDYDHTMDIFSAKRDGSDIKRLTDADGYDAEGAYSPDGSKIVFSSLRDKPDDASMSESELAYAKADPAHFGEIYIMNADGSNQTRLTDWEGYDGGPFFTPDGERIVWRHFEPGGLIADVYTMKLDGSDRRRLSDFGCMSWAPYFHPSGQYCIFNSNKLGMKNWELFIVDPMGEKEPVRVTYTDGADVLPVFAPEGDRLAWTSTRHGSEGRKGQLYIANWDHDAALAALKDAPPRVANSEKMDEAHSELAHFAHKQREAESAKEPTELETFAKKQLEAERNFEPAITEADLRAHVEFLADDKLEGRMTGSPGAKMAAEYIAKLFQAAGLQPLKGDSYLLPFEFLAGVSIADTGNSLTIMDAKTHELTVGKDFLPLNLSQNGTFEGEAVFAGYGIVTDDYDAYGDLDVKDKCVIVLRYFPEEVEVERKTALARNGSLRVKAMQARRLGAKAMLVVSGPNSPHPGELVDLSQDGASGNSGILAACITLDQLKVMIGETQAGRDIKEIQDALDVENPHVQTAFKLPDLKIKMSVELKHEKRTGNNIAAVLPATTNADKADYILVGAHYDHLGHGEGGNAFGYDKDHPQIYNGADDNASGVAAVIEMAGDLAKAAKDGEGFSRNIVFASWSGEELGLLGSEDFVNNSPIPMDRVAAYVNLDMVGRSEDNKLIVQGAGSSPSWRAMLEKRNVPIGFNLTVQDDPYLPTDSTSFYRAKVPGLHFFTGAHQDYHRPSDTAEKLNYPDLERVAKLVKLVTRDLAQRDDRIAYALVERKTEKSSGGAGMRAYTGTEPDYAYTGGDGMKLKAVIPGAPAEQAGIRGGDLIVEIAGLNITNVYEYSHALSVLKPEKPAKVVVMRDGKKIELTITPGVRD